MHGMVAAFSDDVLVEPLKWMVIKDSFLAGLLSPATTRCGLRRPWLDGRGDSGDVTVRHVDLDVAALGEAARDYWASFGDNELFDFGRVATGRDKPIPRLQLSERLAELVLDCTRSRLQTQSVD